MIGDTNVKYTRPTDRLDRPTVSTDLDLDLDLDRSRSIEPHRTHRPTHIIIMSAIASFSTVAVAAPTTATRSNVAKRYARILYDDDAHFIRRRRRETDDDDSAGTDDDSAGTARIGRDRRGVPSEWVCS